MAWAASIFFVPETHGRGAVSLGTPSLRVYWPDAAGRAAWADPPNWRRPGLVLFGEDGEPLLALSETPALDGDPDDLNVLRRGLAATYAVLAPVGTGWDVVARWRAHPNDRLDDVEAPWVLGELLDSEGRCEAVLTVPPQRSRAGAMVNGARLSSVPEVTVEEASAPGQPRARGWRRLLQPDPMAWIVRGSTGQGFVRAERGDAASRRPFPGPWSGRLEIEWPARPTREEQIVALHVADAWLRWEAEWRS
jgi:hypothetical protein